MVAVYHICNGASTSILGVKILFEEKSVISLRVLTEKVLEKANQERITISEKPITQIIYQLNKEEKIIFNQKDGWKIRI